MTCTDGAAAVGDSEGKVRWETMSKLTEMLFGTAQLKRVAAIAAASILAAGGVLVALGEVADLITRVTR